MDLMCMSMWRWQIFVYAHAHVYADTYLYVYLYVRPILWMDSTCVSTEAFSWTGPQVVAIHVQLRFVSRYTA